MLPRIRLALKGFRCRERCVIRTLTTTEQSGLTEARHQLPTPSSQPQFPIQSPPPQQPLYVPENATDKPPVLDIPPESDPLLAYITSHLMSHGKRHAAARRTSRLLLHLHAMTRSPPLPILREAIFLAAPSIRIVSHKHGGKNVQKPIPLSEKQRMHYAVKWILGAAEKRSGKKVEERMAREVLDILKQDPENTVLKKKVAIHHLGMVNRATIKVRR